MAASRCISRLGAWEGYWVERDEEVHRSGVVWCIIYLQATRRARRCCSGCGETVAAVHDVQERRV